MSDESYDPFKIHDPAIIVASDWYDIDAPASLVWDVLVDLENYGRWNPHTVKIESTLQMGDPVHLYQVDYVSPGRISYLVEYICANTPGKLLSWQLPPTESWPYAGRRDQIIRSTSARSCRYISADAFTGEHGLHVMRFAGDWVRRAFNDTGRELKLRAESLYRAVTDDEHPSAGRMSEGGGSVAAELKSTVT